MGVYFSFKRRNIIPPAYRWAAPLSLLFNCIACDVVVNAVCVASPSAFPLATYDTLLQQIAGARLSSATVLVSDLITGASARSLYFPNDTSIVRFQLLHITRVNSVLAADGKDSAAIELVLKAGLTNAAAKHVGVCAIDSASDPSVGGVVPAQPSFLMDLPGSVALVALIGWFVTLLFFGGCWLYYTCFASNPPVELAVVAAPSALPSGIPAYTLVPSVTVEKTELLPPILAPSATPPLEFIRRPTRPFTIDPPPRINTFDMRIPSFDPATRSSNRTFFLDRPAGASAHSAAPAGAR